ncbi:TRAP transporter substrate-binding protein [Aidingimonas halophila]|uniref:Tripartite ATP-independent transporter solute receptor, DctP family n=1 Tax=Aidingimonas halophila TaxID=574349 RepID=A0A1H2V4U1_9GAMM|nr:TRAP transporter substrate-binding protein [Aidingimonas halophila]GHC23748.1 exported protein [Aidingimonas halophila]SDW63335.1 tripartite ATP-independent transporter solute receptor, DctP family [Aidingimonas halophila]
MSNNKTFLLTGLAGISWLALCAHANAAQEVRIATHVSAQSPLAKQAEMFAERIEERLPGEFDFELYPNGQLGKESALIDNLQLDTVEMVNVASGVMKVDDKLGFFDLPWLFEDRAHVQQAMADGLEDALVDTIEGSMSAKVLGIYENGFRHIINSSHPIEEPADLEGMKIRISGGDFRQQIFASLGAAPAKVAWGETFTAMQTGVVDGAEAATYGFYGQKMYEVQDFLSLTRHVYTPSFLLASPGFWDSLSDEQQAVFADVANDMRDDAYAQAAEIEQSNLDAMRSSLEINDVDLAAFREQVQSVYDDYVNRHGSDWLETVHQSADAE